MEVNSAELIEKAIQGNEVAFNKLCEADAKKILFTCMKIMGNKQDGEDAAQEVFLKMKKNLTTLKSPEAYNSWVNRIIVNTCSNVKKKFHKEKGNVPLEEYNELILDYDVEFLPMNYLEEKEKREFLLNTIDNLSTKYKTVIILYYYDGLDRKNIADIMGTSIGAIDHVLARAKSKIKKSLETKFNERISVEGYASFVGVPVVTAALSKEADMVISDQVAKSFFEDTMAKKLGIEAAKKIAVASKGASVLAGTTTVTKVVIVIVTIVSVGIFSFIIPLNLSHPESPSGGYYNDGSVPPQNLLNDNYGALPEGDLDIYIDKDGSTNFEKVEGPNGEIILSDKTLVGRVQSMSSAGNNMNLQDASIANVEVRLLNSQGKIVDKITVESDGSYSLENISIVKNEKYSLKVVAHSNPGVSIVNPNNEGIVEIEIDDRQVQVLPTIYLKDDTDFSFAISLLNKENQVTEVNPSKVLITNANSGEINYTWEIIDEFTKEIVKSGTGTEIEEKNFSLETNGSTKKYILRITAQSNTKTVTEEKEFIVAKRSERTT